MLPNITFLLHMALALGLLYTCFCRLVHTDHNTDKMMRAGLVALGSASSIMAFAPILWAVQPDMWKNMFMASVLFSRVASAKMWADGVPEVFQSFTKQAHETKIKA